jgi:NADH-quinone oxidoreductase subunit J
METALFYLFGAIALIAAISVVMQRRVFYAAASLILCLCAVAVLYLLLEAPFIAAVQVVVYAGAIMVLFLFVIMMLDPFSTTVLKDKKKSLGYLAVLLGIVTFALLYPILKFYDAAYAPKFAGFTTESVGSAENLGHVLFKEYLLPFEATSILILVAIIGVVVLAKRQRQP